MKLFESVLDALAAKVGERVQGRTQSQAYRDAGQKGAGFSVESMVAENLANLILLDFDMPVSGEGERAAFLDSASTEFIGDGLKRMMVQSFLTGDALAVPAWDGAHMHSAIVPAQNFAILGSHGNELTSVAYVVDEKQMRGGSRYSLLQVIDLVPYRTADGGSAKACRYRTFIAKDGAMTDMPLSKFPDWAASAEPEWSVPNVDGILAARFRCPTLNPDAPNAQKGTPLCYGASDPIREIHYLTRQMHEEFGLSEKAVFADRRLFRKDALKDSHGTVTGYKVHLPEGRERLFATVQGQDAPTITEWAPTIQLSPYLDAIDYQLKRVEKCCGLSTGIVSNPESETYVNVDNVRKSTIQTQAMVSSCRAAANSALASMVRSWDTLANYYGVTAPGPFEWQARWSDNYINTFSDQQNAILAGQAIGAMDAYDYRRFVLGETPEQAKARVDEIAARTPTIDTLG